MIRTGRLEIRITPELKAQVQAAAEAESRTTSNYIENLIKAANERKVQKLKNRGDAHRTPPLFLCTYFFSSFTMVE